MLRKIFFYLILYLLSLKSYSLDLSKKFFLKTDVLASSSFHVFDKNYSHNSINIDTQEYLPRYYYNILRIGLGYSLPISDEIYYLPSFYIGRSLQDFTINFKDYNASMDLSLYEFSSENKFSADLMNSIYFFKKNSNFYILFDVNLSVKKISGHLHSLQDQEVSSSKELGSEEKNIFYFGIGYGVGYFLLDRVNLNFSTALNFSSNSSTSSYSLGLSYFF